MLEDVQAPMVIYYRNYFEAVVQSLRTCEDDQEIINYINFGRMPSMNTKKKIINDIQRLLNTETNEQELKNFLKRRYNNVRATLEKKLTSGN